MLKAIELGQILTKKEMKEVKGGGDCCWHNSDWSAHECSGGMSLSEARDAANDIAATTGERTFYCCASC